MCNIVPPRIAIFLHILGSVTNLEGYSLRPIILIVSHQLLVWRAYFGDEEGLAVALPRLLKPLRLHISIFEMGHFVGDIGFYLANIVDMSLNHTYLPQLKFNRVNLLVELCKDFHEFIFVNVDLVSSLNLCILTALLTH